MWIFCVYLFSLLYVQNWSDSKKNVKSFSSSGMDSL